jgi:hypothetical protein
MITDQDDSPNTMMSNGAIAGIIAGVLVFGMIVCGIIIWLHIHKVN